MPSSRVSPGLKRVLWGGLTGLAALLGPALLDLWATSALGSALSSNLGRRLDARVELTRVLVTGPASLRLVGLRAVWDGPGARRWDAPRVDLAFSLGSIAALRPALSRARLHNGSFRWERQGAEASLRRLARRLRGQPPRPGRPGRMRAGGAVLEASFDRVLLRELGRGPGAGPKSLEATGLRLKRGASGQLRGSGRLLSFELASDGRMELHGFALRGREGGARGLRLGWLRVDRGAWIPPGPGPGRAFSLLADELAPDLLQLRLESKGEGPSDRLRASADLDLRNATLGSRLALEELRLGSIYPWPSPVGLGLRGATLRGSASLSAKGRRSLEAKGTATLTRLAVNHSRLAPTTVRFEDATLEGHLRWHRQGSRLALEKASISTGRAKLGLEGELSLSTRRGHGRLVLPATDCALLFASIPKELVPTLGGLRLAGALGGELSLDAQARSLDELTLTARASPNSCRVSRDAPEADVESLRRPFSFVIRPPGWAPTRLVMGPENPDWVPYIRLGRNVIGAFLAAEDRRFFEHRGFDLENIERALAADLKRRGFAKGASSISQQVAKNVFLSHKRTLARKLEEAILTWRLEQVLDKRRILEIYLNLVEMGPGIFGVRAAARRYFGKEPSRLEPLEAAHLAAITPSPRVFHERFKGGRAGMDWLLHLRYLLYQMHRLTWIDKATYERARTKDLHLASY